MRFPAAFTVYQGDTEDEHDKLPYPYYSIRPLRMREALALARWRYAGIYAGYNFGATGQSLDRLHSVDCSELLGTSLYYSVLDSEGDLVGMFSFYPRHENIVEVGLGMRPDKTGQGSGSGIRAGRARLCPRRSSSRPPSSSTWLTSTNALAWSTSGPDSPRPVPSPEGSRAGKRSTFR